MVEQNNKLILQKLKELDDLIEDSECDHNCNTCQFHLYAEEINENTCVLGDIVNEITRVRIE